MHKRSTHKKPAPAKVEHERAPETGARKEIIRTESKPITLAATPKAKASSTLLEDGRREFAQENFEAAERSFQEAINIDPANGIAYYYLAKTKYAQGQFEQASGVLDKAEELLAGSKEWMEAISILREMISHAAN
ncbi:MAG: tetratricopeptide repeat protein [Deltaproteobacteria bacterium]|nr:tetratricopeptide repeat protein [Deltaproteobacteria bacterium]MBI2974408.1 tetratricopeptide repeat protein [Deltaproteobacteria bacterium]